MRMPRIALRCDCGAEGYVDYGERWTCAQCGRGYDTAAIPRAEYDELVRLTRRFRMAIWSVVAVMATVVLAVALTGQLVSIFAGLAVTLLSWFLYIRPIVHRRHRRAVGKLTRTWKVEAL
ncbi:MAG TPA: hypothetical protein VMU66_05420 [Gaiellales bacterium]|nr:hypothetical protein [Gaiellales bacterium]